MAKIVIFSDLHAHTFGAYSHPLEDGTNSRLQDTLDVIDDVRALANELDADAVLFGGDLFHERRHIVTQAFSKVYEALSLFAIDKIPLFMIHGNHDQADKAGRFHALKPFQTYANVVDEPGWTTLETGAEDLHILAVPYIEDTDHLLDIVNIKPPKGEGSKIFLGHFGVDGAKLGADFVYSNGNEPAMGNIPIGRFDAGFLGHFHLHQKMAPNFWYVGAPLQHNWGDKGQVRGCMVYDTETKKAYHHPLNRAPRFVELTLAQATKANVDYSNDFVRIISDKSWSEDRIQETQQDMGCRHLEVVRQKIDVNEAFEIRLKVDPSASYEEMVAEYVKSGLVELEGLEEDHLISIAHRLLAEVSS